MNDHEVSRVAAGYVRCAEDLARFGAHNGGIWDLTADPGQAANASVECAIRCGLVSNAWHMVPAARAPDSRLGGNAATPLEDLARLRGPELG